MGSRTCPRGWPSPSSPGKWPGGQELIIWHLKHLEGVNGGYVEACVAINESLGDRYIVDGGHAEHGECTGSNHRLGVISGVKGNGDLMPRVAPRDIGLRPSGVRLAEELLRVATGCGRLRPAEDARDRAGP